MQEWKEAFRLSVPIFFGYLFLGIAFAILMVQQGFSGWWAILSSMIVYAGSMQFALVSFLGSGMSFWMIALMTLFINARMMFYGISFIDLFKRLGWRAFYVIFALSDETFSVMVGMKQEARYTDRTYVYVAFLNHMYWIFGTIVGVVAGNYITFSTQGIEFSMTALFVVIVTGQYLSTTKRAPFVIGGANAIVWLILVGPSVFLVPSLACTMIAILVLYERDRAKGLVEGVIHHDE